MFKSKIALLALASVCTGLAVVGCSGEGTVDSTNNQADVDLQSVEFNLNVGGAAVETVSFSVTKSNGDVIKAGTFEVPGGDHSFNAQLLLPVGTGYKLTITGNGTKNGSSIPCAGSQTFNVIAGTNPPVDVTVTCTETVQAGNTAPQTGTAVANINFVLDTVTLPGEECGFTHAVVGPLVQQVGNKIDLKSMYVGTGAAANWSATGVAGTFADASADDTTFTCTAVSSGSISANLTAALGCTDTFTVAVSCIGTAICGDGAVNQAGEQCDDGNTAADDGCSATCQTEPVVCGDSDVDAPETCDDGNLTPGDGCNAACKLEGCGNGTPDVGEECDDSNLVSGDGCTAGCKIEFCGDGIDNNGTAEGCDDGNNVDNDACSNACTVNPLCGNGVANAGEECDDNNNTNNDGCSASCKLEVCGDGVLQASETCATCQADVVASGGSCGPVCGNNILEATEDCTTCPADVLATGGTCAPPVSACSTCLSGDPYTAAYNDGQCNVDARCVAVRDCIASTGCFVTTAGSQECLCGNSVSTPGTKATVSECANPAFTVNGPCSAEIKAGSPGSTTNVQLLERQFDFNYPGGVGFGLLAFARDSGICQAACNMQ